MAFETLRVNTNYEICTEYPHVIRKKANGRIISEYVENNGYLTMKFVPSTRMLYVRKQMEE